MPLTAFPLSQLSRVHTPHIPAFPRTVAAQERRRPATAHIIICVCVYYAAHPYLRHGRGGLWLHVNTGEGQPKARLPRRLRRSASSSVAERAGARSIRHIVHCSHCT